MGGLQEVKYENIFTLFVTFLSVKLIVVRKVESYISWCCCHHHEEIPRMHTQKVIWINLSRDMSQMLTQFLKFNFVYLKRSRALSLSISVNLEVFSLNFPLPKISIDVFPLDLTLQLTQKKWQTNLKYWFCGRLFIENWACWIFKRHDSKENFIAGKLSRNDIKIAHLTQFVLNARFFCWTSNLQVHVEMNEK